MKKRILAGASLALALAAQPAEAATYCYTGVSGFSACASANITVNGGLTTLSVAIQNLSGTLGNTIYAITGFGLYYLNPAGSGSVALQSFTGWTNGAGNGLTNPGPSAAHTFIGGARTSNGTNYSLVGCTAASVPADRINTCLTPATFAFNLTPGATFNAAGLHIAVRGQAWSATDGTFTGRSFKCYSTDASCTEYSPPPTSVPEPATMGLLAFGLVSMSAVGIRRRKKGLSA